MAFVRLRRCVGSPRRAIRRESLRTQTVDLVRNSSNNITPCCRTFAPCDARHLCRTRVFGLPLSFRSMLAPAQYAGARFARHLPLPRAADKRIRAASLSDDGDRGSILLPRNEIAPVAVAGPAVGHGAIDLSFNRNRHLRRYRQLHWHVSNLRVAPTDTRLHHPL